jgi:hypothetical protein
MMGSGMCRHFGQRSRRPPNSASAITVALATAKMTANKASYRANARQPPPTASAARASSSRKPGSVHKSFISQVWVGPFVIRTLTRRGGERAPYLNGSGPTASPFPPTRDDNTSASKNAGF